MPTHDTSRPPPRRSRLASLLPWLVLAAALSASTGCRGRPTSEERVRRAREGSGDLVIAAAWPWALRNEIRYGEGLELAIDEVNREGGIGGRRLRLARYDDGESIDQGRVVAQQIADDPDVVAVIGHLQSYITMQTAGTYHQAGLVLVAPTATDPRLTQLGHDRVFRATFTDDATGRALAELVAARGHRRVAVHYIRNDYGRNLANAFEARARQLGVAVQARSSYDSSEQVTERTFDQVLTEWKADEPDAIVLAGEVPAAAIFVAQARRRGIRAPIVGGDAMSSPALISVAGAAAEGTAVASFFHPDDPSAEVARFRAAFTARYGGPPDAGSALGYDCVRLIAHAMKAARSPVPDDVAGALHRLRDWRGVTGTFSFDRSGDPHKPVRFQVVRGGVFAFLPTADAAEPGGASGRAAGLAP